MFLSGHAANQEKLVLALIETGLNISMSFI